RIDRRFHRASYERRVRRERAVRPAHRARTAGAECRDRAGYPDEPPDRFDHRVLRDREAAVYKAGADRGYGTRHEEGIGVTGARPRGRGGAVCDDGAESAERARPGLLRQAGNQTTDLTRHAADGSPLWGPQRYQPRLVCARINAAGSRLSL